MLTIFRPSLAKARMDLMHLLGSAPSVEQESSEELVERKEVEEPVDRREALYKRRGINFSTTSSEGRILRSNQVSHQSRVLLLNKGNLLSPPR